jgi:hypothetical protein
MPADDLPISVTAPEFYDRARSTTLLLTGAGSKADARGGPGGRRVTAESIGAFNSGRELLLFAAVGGEHVVHPWSTS